MSGILGLKIDVDTYQGMKLGVTRLLSLLAAEGVRATFFLSIGPDASGRAVLQMIKNPRFLKKMVRSRACEPLRCEDRPVRHAPALAEDRPLLSGSRPADHRRGARGAVSRLGPPALGRTSCRKSRRSGSATGSARGVEGFERLTGKKSRPRSALRLG